MSQRPTIFSFFAGSGFLDLGFENSGYHIAFVNEYFPPFMEAYKYSRTNLNLPLPEYGYYQGSITDFLTGEPQQKLKEYIKNARQNNDIIGFIGGPPCPDFSVGGKNKGKEGDHGKLSGSYIALICQIQPDFFLFENVKGLWRTKIHRAFYDELKQQAKKAGYHLTERLINAIEYGTPQDRERIILIGFHKQVLNSLGMKKLKNVPFPWEKYIKYPKEKVFAYSWPETHPFEEDSIFPCPQDIPPELSVEYWFKNNEVINHSNAEQFFKPRAGMKRFASVLEGDDSKKSYKRLHRWRYSPTACYGNNEVHLHPYKIRRLSVAEVLAIQSLPKDFVLPPHLSLSNLFKTVGNGVPYLASKALAESILNFLTLNK